MGAYTGAAIQTVNVLFVLLCSFMKGASCKELLSVEGFQPCRLLNSLNYMHQFNQNQNYQTIIYMIHKDNENYGIEKTERDRDKP